MSTLKTSLIAALVAVAAGSAAAHTGTDAARALAERATASQAALAPVPATVALGDYRAAAHEEARVAQWEARQQAIRAYAAGVRSAPIAVSSEDSARAEAQRVNAERALSVQAAATQPVLAAN